MTRGDGHWGPIQATPGICCFLHRMVDANKVNKEGRALRTFTAATERPSASAASCAIGNCNATAVRYNHKPAPQADG